MAIILKQSPKVKPDWQQITQGDENCFLVNNQFSNLFDANWFNAHYWQAKKAVTGTATGRGTTYFIKHAQQQWVLRHYYRGGLIGKLIHDQYLFTGLPKTRSFAEFQLLAQLAKQGLPVPTPIAAKVQRQNQYYRADIITQRIKHAQDVCQLLQQHNLTDQLWQQIGKTLAQFHQVGAYHHDLNCHNILIDNNQKIWLIDFDQGKFKTPKPSWQQSNLQRLLRSFEKEQKRLPQFYWQPLNWDNLLRGYQTQMQSNNSA